MEGSEKRTCAAFLGDVRIAAGDYGTVALEAKRRVEEGERTPILIFDDATGAQIDFDLRGTPEEVRARLERADAAPRGPGRPRLGVVAREVTLLPRHWDWLASQPGGASVALRKLVDQARRANEPADRVRRSREAAYRFMSAVAGNRPGFEEAARALFAGDDARIAGLVDEWPADVREHVLRLAAGGVEPEPS